MEDKKQRLGATIDDVLAVADKWAALMTDPMVRSTLDVLRDVSARIAELERRQVPLKGSSARTAQIGAWSDTLRDKHLLVIQSIADLHLTDESGRSIKLNVPHRRAKPDDLLQAAKQFDATIRPSLPALVAKGISADILDKMQDAANQLTLWRTNAPNQHTQHKELGDEIDELMAQGRKGIKLLARLLAQPLRENSMFRSDFMDAATASIKPGPPKSVGTKTLLNELKRPKRTRTRPVRFEDRFEIPEVPEIPENRDNPDNPENPENRAQPS
jgi:hypothetical protein